MALQFVTNNKQELNGSLINKPSKAYLVNCAMSNDASSSGLQTRVCIVLLSFIRPLNIPLPMRHGSIGQLRGLHFLQQPQHNHLATYFCC